MSIVQLKQDIEVHVESHVGNPVQQDTRGWDDEDSTAKKEYNNNK